MDIYFNSLVLPFIVLELRCSSTLYSLSLSRLYRYDVAVAQGGDSRLLSFYERAMHKSDKVCSCFDGCSACFSC